MKRSDRWHCVIPQPVLKQAKALVVGIANEHSIAWGCAKAFRELGAELAMTYLNDKARRVRRAAGARTRSTTLFLPLDVSVPGQLEAVFEAIETAVGLARHPGSFDRVGAEGRPAGRAADCSADGFAKAIDISCHSFIRMARLAAPLMKNGGTMFAMSYYGANRVVPNYNVMGPVKAALEAVVPLPGL